MEKYIPPFSISYEMVNYISLIVTKLSKFEGYQNLNRMPILRRNNKIESIHSSLAIEANSLTLGQVKDVINGKVVLGSQKEIQEVKNAYEAYELIKNINPYSVNDLKKIHGVMTSLLIDEPGKFRRGNEGVFDGEKCIFIAPPPDRVAPLIEQLFKWMEENKEKIHPLILSSVFHYEFVFIHPFCDGNGRMARLWQNVLLSKWNEIFEYIPIESEIKKYQSDYYKAISICHVKGDSSTFIEFMLKTINNILDELLGKMNEELKHLGNYVDKLLSVMPNNVPLSANEIMDKLKIKSKETLRDVYLTPAIKNGLVKLTIPNKPTSKNQKYYKVD